MKSDFFWKSWDKPYKRLYQALLFLLGSAFILYVIAFQFGSSFVIAWEVESQVDPVKTIIGTYRAGFFEYPIAVDNYVISQSFFASDLRVQNWPAYVLAAWMGVFLSIIMGLICSLSRFWFVVSILLLTGLFVGLKLDYLLLFGAYEKVGLAVVMILYFPVLYIFHFVKQDAGLPLRIATFLFLTAIFGSIIYFFSNVSAPFLHFVNYGIYVPVILSILFAFMVGHEILSGLLRIITSGAGESDSKGLVHFLIIGMVFLLNASLLVMKNSRWFEIDIYLIGAFWLLTIASVIGIWGYRSKESTYEGIYSFYPHGAFLFLCLAITAHLTIAFFLVTGNDVFVEVLEDAIVFSQLGFSLMFMIYVLANFFDLFARDLNIGKVLYKPGRMPYFISQFASVIVVMALFFRFNMTPYYQAVAGFYSGIGDLYMKVEDYLSATEYYKLSNIYSETSHRANYAMATMERRLGNRQEELAFLEKAVEKNPTDFAFANLAAIYLKENRYFRSIFTLQDGLEQFPGNGFLLNNLGLVYLELPNVDSAFHYLNNASAETAASATSASNIYALLSKEGLLIRQDTLHHLLGKTSYLPAVNNLLVLANQLGVTSDDKMELQWGIPYDTEAAQIIYNYNKSINDPSLVDSSYLSELNVFYDSSSTSWFQDQSRFAASVAFYLNGKVAQSLELLSLLAIQNPDKEYYSFLARLVASQGATGLAIDLFKKAFQNGRLEVAPELAFAYMGNGEFDKAEFIWRQLLQRDDSLSMELAQKMLRVIDAEEINDILDTDIDVRFSFLAFRYREFDLEQLEGLVLTFDNSDLIALGFIHLFEAYLELGRDQKALDLLEELGRLNVSKVEIMDAINLAQCKYAYFTGNEVIMERLSTNLQSEDLQVNSYLKLFGAMEQIAFYGNDQDTAAFEQLGRRNPFFEPGVVEAVKYFNANRHNPERAYEIILAAVKANPFSVLYNKLYALQCLEVGLDDYALETLQELKFMMDSVSYETFKEEFYATLKKLESNLGDWQLSE